MEIEHPNLKLSVAVDAIYLPLVIRTILLHDFQFAAGSFLVLMTLIWIHVQNIGVMILGMTQLALAFPCAYYVLYRIVGWTEPLHILNALSLFVMMGIGADDLFLIVDAWKHAKTKYPLDWVGVRF